jgi:ribonuclease P protein component
MPAFPRNARLSGPEQYATVFDAPAIRVSSAAFLLLAAHSQYECARVGIIVARKHIRLANRRNRIKRLVREQFRCSPLNLTLDMVVLVRAHADQLTNQEVSIDLKQLWKKANERSSQP